MSLVNTGIKKNYFLQIHKYIDMPVEPEYQIIFITIPLFIVGSTF